MTKNIERCMKGIEKKLVCNGYSEALQKCKSALKGNELNLLFTPNAEIIYSACKSRELLCALRNSHILLPDGIAMYLYMKKKKFPVKRRTNGIDFAEILIGYASRHGLRIFLLGAKEGLGEKAAENLCCRYKNLCICGTKDGYFEKDGIESDKVIKLINDSHADIVFVCLGSPLQELWLYKNRKKFRYAKLALGLGGSIDVWSGNIKRAPYLLRKIGFEWLYRVILQPKRIKRILPSMNFIFR